MLATVRQCVRGESAMGVAPVAAEGAPPSLPSFFRGKLLLWMAQLICVGFRLLLALVRERQAPNVGALIPQSTGWGAMQNETHTEEG